VMMVPVLTVVSDAMGMVGGWLIARWELNVASTVYWNSIVEGLVIQDAWMALVKPVFLGYIVVAIGCHVGLNVKGGTQGVGRGATKAVVSASVAVLALDFFITKLLVFLLY